ncbi:hypothetical protein K2X96_00710 [Patescibacteria group bacterium]|nr:hypothetical protein [Patescibacteria group bacterium]
MFRWLKKHFIPHHGNGHQPHFLRERNIRALIVVVLVAELCLLVFPFVPALRFTNSNFITSVLPAVLNDLTNEERETQSFATLTVNPELNAVAELKARDMAEKGYFAHTSPEGKEPWYWFNYVGYDYEYAGENLAVDFVDSEDVTKGWMNSPTHKANILKGVYTEMGTGVATGIYEGRETIFVAQVYARPKSAAPAPTKTVETSIPAVVPSASSNTESVPAPTPLEVSVPEGSVETIILEEVRDAVAEEQEQTGIAFDVPTVLGVDTSQAGTTQASMFDKFITSPQRVANGVIGFLALLLAVALILKMLIRMDKQHPVLITNGLAALTIVLGVFTTNTFLEERDQVVTTSYASFYEETLE